MNSIKWRSCQLINDLDLTGHKERYTASGARWGSFSIALLDEDSIVHLWPKKSFREGVQLANSIGNVLWMHSLKVREWALLSRVADDVVEYLDFESCYEAVELLQEALRIIAESDHKRYGLNEDDIAQLETDLKTFASIAKALFEFNLAEEKIAEQFLIQVAA